MNMSFVGSPRLFLPLGLFVFCCLLVASVSIGYVAASQAPDNTSQNKDQTSPTADKQKMNASDREITQKIRKSVHQDSSLSTYAHNIKIITQNGKVTLRGPVRSDDEKANLQAKAIAVAGDGNVTNELEIAPPK
jgi:hyperosmotically inducible periplasmic protein